MPRLVVVSNRVAPIQEGEATAGGLAAGVLDALKQKGGLWFGWSGEVTAAGEPKGAQPAVRPAASSSASEGAVPEGAVPEGAVPEGAVPEGAVPEGPASERPASERNVGPITLFTIDLSRRDYDEFYRGFANGTLWPVLHYQIGLGRFEWAEFEGYHRVNKLFAAGLTPLVRPDDLIWVHDYHLLCLADALRANGLTNRIGLFLHTPFPAPGVFMTIPAHAALIRSMCAYDLLGFQTEIDRTAFLDYLLHYAGGVPVGGDHASTISVSVFGRIVRAGVYPIGVHVDEVRAQAETPVNRRQATRMRANLLERLILSVDRLDYSKGLRQRFAAFERFLAEYPAQHGLVTFMQIAPPSRSDIDTYQRIRRELEGEAGRINGRFAEVDWVPLRYLNRSFARNVLMPLYAEAQACLVTPLRDGMNLVAKEYVAAQDPEEPGVLILSEFAGAARELDAALLVNPYDEAGMARAMDRALSMPVEERQERHQAMLRVMRTNSLERWRDRFEADLRGF